MEGYFQNQSAYALMHLADPKRPDALSRFDRDEATHNCELERSARRAARLAARLRFGWARAAQFRAKELKGTV